eukprot:6185957-Pleurochrysis_carterae.AAC.3
MRSSLAGKRLRQGQRRTGAWMREDQRGGREPARDVEAGGASARDGGLGSMAGGKGLRGEVSGSSRSGCSTGGDGMLVKRRRDRPPWSRVPAPTLTLTATCTHTLVTPSLPTSTGPMEPSSSSGFGHPR